MLKSAQIVFAPYNYILDPFIVAQRELAMTDNVRTLYSFKLDLGNHGVTDKVAIFLRRLVYYFNDNECYKGRLFQYKCKGSFANYASCMF